MFLLTFEYLKKIKNIADMCKQLRINVYIWSEKGVRKSFLAKYIALNVTTNPKVSTANPVILENFYKTPLFEFKNNFVVVTKSIFKQRFFKKYFAMDIELKPMKNHPEDIEDFVDLFKKQTKEELKINKHINIKNSNTSKNLNSLKDKFIRYICFRKIKTKFSIFSNTMKISTKTLYTKKSLEVLKKRFLTQCVKNIKANSKLQIIPLPKKTSYNFHTFTKTYK